MHTHELAASAYFFRHQIQFKAHQYPVDGKGKVRLLQRWYALLVWQFSNDHKKQRL